MEKEVKTEVLDVARESPAYAMTVEEKGRFMNISLTYPAKDFMPQLVTLAHRELVGFDSDDLLKVIVTVFKDLSLDITKLLCFIADGATVMGTLHCLSWGLRLGRTSRLFWLHTVN